MSCPPISNELELAEESSGALSHDYDAQMASAHLTSIKGPQTTEESSTSTEFGEAIEAAQKHANGSDKHHGFLLPSSCFKEQKVETSTIAHRTLTIHELLEQVLLHAGVRAIINMRQVAKEIKDQIDASPRLQSKLHYKTIDKYKFGKNPTFATHFEAGFPGFMVSFHSRGLNKQKPYICATFTLGAGKTKLPRIGETWKEMFICSPPAKKMQVSIGCCRPHCPFPTSSVSHIVAGNGLTVGDLYIRATQCVFYDRICKTCASDLAIRKAFLIDGRMFGQVRRHVLDHHFSSTTVYFDRVED